MNIEEISNEQQFEMVITQHNDVLIDFWAPWCGPCKAMLPIFEQIADEHQQRIKAIKVNVDDNPTIAQKYGIRSIPSLLLMKNKLVASEHVGAAPKNAVLDWLNQNEGEHYES